MHTTRLWLVKMQRVSMQYLKCFTPQSQVESITLNMFLTRLKMQKRMFRREVKIFNE